MRKSFKALQTGDWLNIDGRATMVKFTRSCFVYVNGTRHAATMWFSEGNNGININSVTIKVYPNRESILQDVK